MPNRLYGDGPSRGPAWFTLFEELSNLPWNGATELHKTNRGNSYKSVDEEGNRKYPPVYRIEFVPRMWDRFSQDQLNILFEIADRHEATVNLSSRKDGRGGTEFVVQFNHR